MSRLIALRRDADIPTALRTGCPDDTFGVATITVGMLRSLGLLVATTRPDRSPPEPMSETDPDAWHVDASLSVDLGKTQLRELQKKISLACAIASWPGTPPITTWPPTGVAPQGWQGF